MAVKRRFHRRLGFFSPARRTSSRQRRLSLTLLLVFCLNLKGNSRKIERISLKNNFVMIAAKILIAFVLLITLTAVEVPFNAADYLKEGDDKPRPPILLLPGLVSSRLVAWKRKVCRGPDIQIQDGDYFPLLYPYPFYTSTP